MWMQSSLVSTRIFGYSPFKSKLLNFINTNCNPNVQRQILVSNDVGNAPQSLQRVIRSIRKNGQRLLLQVSNPPYTLASQSVILPGTDNVRATAIVRDPCKLIEYPDIATKTINDVILSGLSKSENGDCLGTRSKNTGQYEWISYSEVQDRRMYVGSGIIALGIPAGNKSLIGIKTKNRSEFLLTMLGCSCYSMVIVPLYDNFGTESSMTILNDCEMEIVICETANIAMSILKECQKYPLLKHIVVIDSTDSEMSSLKGFDQNILRFSELEDLGKNNIQKPKPPAPDDLFAICYTSGTTGIPKGVMLTHCNVMSCIGSSKTIVGEIVSRGSTVLSYLPCAHIYEIIFEVLCMYHGGRLGFYSGENEKLLDDIKVLKPNALTLVPKIMNVMYSEVCRNIMPHPLKRIIFKISLLMKERNLKRGVISRTTLWDKLIFYKFQELLGGNVEIIMTSSAPISKDVMTFFRCSTGCLVFEAYGKSEACAVAMTLLAEHDTGFVGPPLPSNHIKLIDAPELDYFSINDVGEICVRGPNVFKGYYKNPKATREALDEDGWHHTGDIGKWLPNGALSIIDRKQHIFKLSQGEYIAPEKTENAYSESLIVSHIFVDGDSSKDFVIAIAVPNKDFFMKWLKENNFTEENFEEACQKYDIRQAVLKHLLVLGRKRGLNSLHQVGNLYLHPEPFSIKNGLLTPTMKVRREIARKHFANTIQWLYEEGSMKGKVI